MEGTTNEFDVPSSSRRFALSSPEFSLFSYAQLLSGRSNIFRVGFPPQSSRIILTTQTQIHHFIEDNIPNFPIRKLLLRISDMNPLNEYYK